MDQSTIPYYNVYFTDTWKFKPTLTLNYGLAWTLEMPPKEQDGLQIVLVDSANQLVSEKAYINTRKREALQGVAYNPILGYSLVGNSENGRKYPYNPYYGSFSPRVGLAWNPNFDSGLMGHIFGHGKTVVRGGFSILYGRLNGVDLVLVPLLGTGLIQPVQCTGALSGMGTPGGSCGPGGAQTAATAFRLGPGTGLAGQWDGLVAPLPAAANTLPQLNLPGVNSVAAGAGEVLDPNFRPNKSYTFDFTIQRQITPKLSIEAGYIGRILRNEYQPVNINAVPYMMTYGPGCDPTYGCGSGTGQQFQNAYANVEAALGCTTGNYAACGGGVPSKTVCTANCGMVGEVDSPNPAYTAFFNGIAQQPFFEAGLAGSSFCTGSYAGVAYASCTAGVALTQASKFTKQQVWSLYSTLDPSFVFGRTMQNSPIPANCGMGTGFGCNGQTSSGIGVNASVGFGNYNALFLTFKSSDWHGLTSQTNFTWGKAMGTGAVAQATSEYTPDDPYYIGRQYTQQPFDRQFIFNTFFVYAPPYYKSQQGFMGHLLGGWSFSPIFVAASGLPLEINTTNGDSQAFGEGDSANFFSYETGVPITNKYNTGSASRVNCGGAVCGADPASVANFRNPILGFDMGHNSFVLRGMPLWNVDFSIKKNTHITERIGFEFQVVFANVFNHMQASDPYYDLSDPGDWGLAIVPSFSNQQANTPRQIEFGFRIRF